LISLPAKKSSAHAGEAAMGMSMSIKQIMENARRIIPASALEHSDAFEGRS
jgi:hypothetical protein